MRGKSLIRQLPGDLIIILLLLFVLASGVMPLQWACAREPALSPAKEINPAAPALRLALAVQPVRVPENALFNSALPSSQAVPLAAPDSLQRQKSPPARESATTIYSYRVLHIYPHDPGAFTQGLLYHNGCLYEGTGLHGKSSLRKVALKTGKVLKINHLPGKYFGEGIALCGKRLIQLTYQSKIGFIYDLELRPVGSFKYPFEGWGLTCDGSRLILSDGTATLRWLDARTFKVLKHIIVTDRGRPVAHLNELEYVKGEIFANIWKTDTIARISPDTGEVKGWIDLGGLWQQNEPKTPIDYLNGIAYDEKEDRLFVTGKLWPKLFEIELINK